MFYCGFDPGLEAYPATQDIDTAPAPEPTQFWAASAVLAITILGLITMGLS